MRYDYCPFARKDAPGKYHCIQPCCWFGGCEAPPRKGSDGRELPPAAIKAVPRELPQEMLRKPEPDGEEISKKVTVKQRHEKLIAEAKKLIANGVTGQQILAKRLGITAATLLNIEKRYPGEIVYKRKTHQYDWSVLGPQIDELLAKGASKAEIRRKFKLSKTTLFNYCLGRGVHE